MSREDSDNLYFFSKLIDDYVGVEPSPTEKQRKWREVTRYRHKCLKPGPKCLLLLFFSALFAVESFRRIAGFFATA